MAWILAAVMAVGLMGLIDLATLPGWVDQRYIWSVPLETSWGSMFTFVFAGAYIWIAIRPARSGPAVIQLGIGSAALVIACAASQDIRPLWVAVAVAGSAVLFTWLTGGVATVLSGERSVHWPLLLLAAAGLPLWFPYIVHAVEGAYTAEESLTWDIDHWPVQAAAGITLALCAAVMAFWAPGRALLRVTVSVSAVLIGIALLAYPDRQGATESMLWGIAVVLWGLALALPAANNVSDRMDSGHRRP